MCVQLGKGCVSVASVHQALHDCFILSNIEVCEDIFELVLLNDALAQTLEAGEFVDIQVPGNPTQLIRVPLSFSHVDKEAGLIYITYARVGDATKRLSSLGAKTMLNVLGPCGNGWKLPQSKNTALLVAGGIGAPPVLGAALMLAQAHITCDVILGAKTKNRVWGINLAHKFGVRRVVVATDDGTLGEHAFTPEVAQALMEKEPYGSVFTCGPQIMMEKIARLAEENDIECQVSMERMMTCGFGACATCNVAMRTGGYKGCCAAGPVFDAKEIQW